jgi:hypothetical protein
VFDDADLEAAATAAVKARFHNSGQSCVCASDSASTTRSPKVEHEPSVEMSEHGPEPRWGFSPPYWPQLFGRLDRAASSVADVIKAAGSEFPSWPMSPDYAISLSAVC